MSQNKVAIIVGTRPEIIKMQPIIKCVENRNDMELLFIHTGQHYDWNLSGRFIEELDLPQPNAFLNVKSGSHGAQTARIIIRCEKVLKKERPNFVLVEGDTNSALGAALATSKLKIPVGHVEAGCRSFDRNMPEEINRILIADLATLHFASTDTCVQNLINEGIAKEKIHLTGHPIVDLLYKVQNKINKNVLSIYGLEENQYYFVTTHREENIENPHILNDILDALSMLARSRPIIYPIHPHTLRSIRKFRLKKYLKNLIITGPLSYLETLSLIKYARIVLTDSGGIQQEAALLEIPCITLRNNTEWVETINYGINFLARSREEIIVTAKKLEEEFEYVKNRLKNTKNIFGEPNSASKIIDIVNNFVLG